MTGKRTDKIAPNPIKGRNSNTAGDVSSVARYTRDHPARLADTPKPAGGLGPASFSAASRRMNVEAKTKGRKFDDAARVEIGSATMRKPARTAAVHNQTPPVTKKFKPGDTMVDYLKPAKRKGR